MTNYTSNSKDPSINTGGGANVGENINAGNDAIGRDKTVVTTNTTNTTNNYYSPVEPLSQGTQRKNPDLQELERRYRERALQEYDVSKFVKLPQDVIKNLATSARRQLYIPLHIKSINSSGVQADQDGFTKIEKWSERPFRDRFDDDIEQDEYEWEGEDERLSIRDQLKKSHNLVILGHPGTGKSTLLQWIATGLLLRHNNDSNLQNLPGVNSLPEEDFLPIIIRCRDFDNSFKSGKKLQHFIQHAVLEKLEIDEEFSSFLVDRINSSQAILLIDGLDEITDHEQYENFCELLGRHQNNYPDAYIVVTSRIAGYSDMGQQLQQQGFEHLLITELTITDKVDFVHRWYQVFTTAARKSIDENSLIGNLRNDPGVEQLTGIPMLLTTIVSIWWKDIELHPKNRVQLYSASVEQLLQWKSHQKKQFKIDEAIPQLSYIAYAMCRNGDLQLSKEEILNRLQEMRDNYPSQGYKRLEAHEFLDIVLEHTAILNKTKQVGHDVYYEFQHRSLQEYLAAYALWKGLYPDKQLSIPVTDHISQLLSENITESRTRSGETKPVISERWREPIRLYVACCDNHGDIDKALRAILNSRKNEGSQFVRPRAVLAASCLVDQLQASDLIAQEVLRVFVRQIEDGDGNSSSVKTSLAEVAINLAKTKSVRLVTMLQNTLIEEFCKPNGTDRIEVGALCGRVIVATYSTNPLEVEQWFKDRLSDLFCDERSAISAALGIMQLAFERKAFLVSEIVPKLLDRLKNNDAATIAAAWALGWLNSAKLGTKVWRTSDSDREKLIEVISKKNFDPNATRFLTWILRNQKELDRRAVEPLIDRLKEPNPTVREAVAETLGWISDKKAVDELCKLLENENDNAVKRKTVEALGRLADVQGVKTLRKKIKERDSGILESVVQALGHIGEQVALDDLTDLLQECDDMFVRYRILEAIGKIGMPVEDKRLVGLLVQELEQPSSLLKQWAAFVLSQICLDIKDQIVRKQVIDALIEMQIREKNIYTQIEAIRALAKFKTTYAVNALLAALRDIRTQKQDRLLQIEIIRSLGQRGNLRVIDELMSNLKAENDNNVWLATVNALGEIGSSKVIDQLKERLNDKDIDVQHVVVQALGKIRDANAKPYLLTCLKSEKNVIIRRAALDALTRIEYVDKTDRKLLSVDLNGVPPFIDPLAPVTSRMRDCAVKRLELSAEAIQIRYERLAQTFELKLDW